MDPNGNIHKLPDPYANLEEINDFKDRLEALGVKTEELEPIPDRDLPRVKRMNRKARRRWYARQRNCRNRG